MQVDRRQLQQQLAVCDSTDAQWRAAHDAAVAADRETEEAVQQHQATTADIQRELSGGPGAERRAVLMAQLDAANTTLDSRCKALRARIESMQKQLLAVQERRPQRNLIELQLIASASLEMQHQRWHLAQESLWLEARRSAAKKKLAAAEAAFKNTNVSATAADETDVERWRAEFGQLEAAVAAVLVEAGAVRQQMLNE